MTDSGVRDSLLCGIIRTEVRIRTGTVLTESREGNMADEAFYKNKDIREQMAFWDAKAKPCSNYERRSEYAEKFLKLSGIRAGESVFDMGCGSGTLCLPLADDGHRVFCADFSDRMLQSLRDVVEEEHLTLLTLRKLSWQEDWAELELPVCDLAFASRSLFGVDPADAVEKLSGRAGRRVCITLPVNAGMFENADSPYSLGTAEEVNAFADACIAEVRRHGYVPEVLPILGGNGKESRWIFLAWDK